MEDSKIAPREANTLLVLHLDSDVHEIINAFLAPCCASLDSVRWLGFKPSSLKSLEFCVVETSFSAMVAEPKGTKGEDCEDYDDNVPCHGLPKWQCVGEHPSSWGPKTF